MSLSPYADDVLPEYVRAEKTGRDRGACYEYYKDCKKSLYSTVTENKYRWVAWDIGVRLSCSAPVITL